MSNMPYGSQEKDRSTEDPRVIAVSVRPNLKVAKVELIMISISALLQLSARDWPHKPVLKSEGWRN